MVDIGELKRRKDFGGLIDALADEDWDVHWGAAKALGEIGEPAVEPLITALGDEEERVRRNAAKALGEIGDKRAVDPLITALGAEDWVVRSCAAEALGEIGDKRAVEPLINTLGDTSYEVCCSAATALVKIGDKRAVDPLITALGAEDWVVRSCAAEALGEIGDKRVVDLLITALGDGAEDVRSSAAGALGELGDARAVEPLITALTDECDRVRWYAAEALGKIGDVRAVEPLIIAIGDNENYLPGVIDSGRGMFADTCTMRERATIALGKIGDPRAITVLEKATSDSNENVRNKAKEALDMIKSKMKETEPKKIVLKSKSEYHGANIDFKVSIENQLDHSIADVKATLFVPQVFLLSEKEKTIGLIKPKERQTTTFAIRPTGECGDCVIEGDVTYFDTASNSHERIRIKPKSVAVKCAILKRFKTGDDAWFDLVATLISTKETHEEIPVPAEILFNVATHALRSMSLFMLEPVRNSTPGYFSGSARYAAMGSVGGMKYAAQLNVIGSEAAPSKLVLEAWAEEESALVGFYHRMLDTLEEQTEVKERSLFIGSYTHIEKNVDGDDLSSGGTKITGDVVAPRSTIGGGGGGKPFSNCPHCGEALNLEETPRFCPYCGGKLR